MQNDSTPNPDVLTPREKEILTLISQGYTSVHIGTILNLSPKTINAHRDSIRKKLRVKNIAGLIRYALKYKLVE